MGDYQFVSHLTFSGITWKVEISPDKQKNYIISLQLFFKDRILREEM